MSFLPPGVDMCSVCVCVDVPRRLQNENSQSIPAYILSLHTRFANVAVVIFWCYFQMHLLENDGSVKEIYNGGRRVGGFTVGL